MNEWLKSWIMGGLGAAILCALCGELTPPGRVRTVQRMLCGMVMMLAILSPVFRLDLSGYAVDTAKYRTHAMEAAARADEEYRSLSRTYIETELRAYILNKAAQLGAAVTDARVTLEWDRGGFWFPAEAEIWGEYSQRLAVIIETELGINSEMQHWSGK